MCLQLLTESMLLKAQTSYLTQLSQQQHLVSVALCTAASKAHVCTVDVQHQFGRLLSDRQSTRIVEQSHTRKLSW